MQKSQKFPPQTPHASNTDKLRHAAVRAYQQASEPKKRRIHFENVYPRIIRKLERFIKPNDAAAQLLIESLFLCAFALDLNQCARELRMLDEELDHLLRAKLYPIERPY